MQEESDYLEYNVLHNEDGQIKIEAENGTLITLSFSKEDNPDVEKAVLENLILSFEKRFLKKI